jgi:hypothetical protein
MLVLPDVARFETKGIDQEDMRLGDWGDRYRPWKQSEGECMTTRGSRLMKLGVAVVAAVAALAVAVPSASASLPASSVKGFSEDRTTFGSLAACQNIFTGPATFDNHIGRIKADIKSVTFNFCDTGTSVTANALPWKLDLQRDDSYAISGVDVNITTSQGTCRYTGSIDGVGQFPDVYDLRGTLNRQTAGCGGPDQINVSNLTEVISFS